MSARCICGCGSRAVHGHEVVYKQEVRRLHGDMRDRRNYVDLCLACHMAHHNRMRPLHLAVLPDEAFAFARDLLGGGAAFVYLGRRYAGEDRRLDALLDESTGVS